jgi:hypothetical protein
MEKIEMNNSKDCGSKGATRKCPERGLELRLWLKD